MLGAITGSGPIPLIVYPGMAVAARLPARSLPPAPIAFSTPTTRLDTVWPNCRVPRSKVQALPLCVSVPMPDSSAKAGAAAVPASTWLLTIVVCASGANTDSPPVGVMLTCKSLLGSEPSTAPGTCTVNCALVCPAEIVTDPLGRVPPKSEASRNPAPGAVTA